MDQYTLTKSRTIQWIIIILVLFGMVGGYWYFQTHAAVTMKTANKTGLVGYWNFDEGTGTTAYDKSGQNNTGTLTNGPTWVDGKFGKAASFDGTNDKINAGTGSSLNLTTAVTISAWIYPTSFGDRPRIVDKLGSNVGYILLLDNVNTTNGLGFGINVAGSIGTDYGYATNVITLNRWQNVAVTYSGSGTLSLYVDGVKVTTAKNMTQSISSNASNPLYIAGRSTDNLRQFSGRMDEVRVYNQVLSATEIANLYALGTATVNASQNTSLTNGLVGQWSLDGKNTAWTSSVAGTTADTSGNGTTGTLTNMSQITSPVPGKIGQAFDFFPNGADTNAYANMGDPASGILDFGTGDFSVGFWMKGAGYSSQGSGVNVPLAKKSYNSVGNGYGFSYGSTNILTFIIANGTTGYSASDISATTNDNLWHHYVGVRSGGTMYLYRDGAVRGTNVTVSGSSSTSSALTIGTDGALNGQRNVNALIDDVRIYNRALSATEAQSLYDLGQSDMINSSLSQTQGTGRLDSGLAGYWALDDNTGTSATDSSTNGNVGTLTNGPTWTTGQIGSAVNFDGVDDYVSVANNASLNIGTSDVTFSAWIKPSNTTAIRGIINKRNTASPYQQYDFSIGYVNSSGSFVASKKIGCFLFNGGLFSTSNTQSAYTTNDVVDGNWHFVQCVRQNGSSLKMYVDGVSVPVTYVFNGTTNVNPDSTAPVYIGALSTSSSFFDGPIDDVRIYNRAISADEISQLYRLAVPTGTDTGLKGYWSFNGQDVSWSSSTAAKVADASGSGNTGTLTNMSQVTSPVPGKIGQAASFDGTDDYVTIPDSASVNPSSALSVSAWVKTSSTTLSQTVIGKYRSQGNDREYWLSIGNGTTAGVVYAIVSADGVGVNTRISSTTVNDGKWHLITMTFSATGIVYPNVYIDGVLSNGTTTGANNIGSIFNGTEPLTISSVVNTSGVRVQYFDGSIDEVRIYDRALSATEVTALYNTGR